jgi:hypothetical protein
MLYPNGGPSILRATDPDGLNRPIPGLPLSTEWLAILAPWFWGLVFVTVALIGETFIHVSLLKDASFGRYLLHPGAHEYRTRIWAAIVWALASGFLSITSSAHVRRMRQVRAEQRKVAAASHRFAYSDSETRSELSTRLHEGLAQELTAAQLFLKGIECAQCDKTVTPVLGTVDLILANCIRQCRDIAQELSPQALDVRGLLPALEVRGAEISLRSGKRVTVDRADGSQALGRTVLLMAFDVVDRALRTLADSPWVSSIAVHSEALADRLVVSVEWTGDFEPELEIEKFYAESVGAELTPVAGTHRIELSLPVTSMLPSSGLVPSSHELAR